VLQAVPHIQRWRMSVCRLSHIALLVASLEATTRRLGAIATAAATVAEGQGEDCPHEGTREIYLGPRGATSRLLLCQATNPVGPYGRALARRGPGLHHIALSVPRIEEYLDGLAGSGWYVLPQSVRMIARGGAWLARPGVHALVEICQMPEQAAEPFVTEVEIPMQAPDQRLIERLGVAGRPLHGVRAMPVGPAHLTVAGQRVDIGELARA
jgi:methylmalonyl-CoA/ethylmalonyl-CoA epimerase